MPTQFSIPPYNNALAYKQYDAVYGIYDGVASIHASPYFYATQNIGPGAYSPSGFYRFPITAWSIAEDIVTLTYSHTGGPPFAMGSQIRVTGITASSAVNYTGMVVQGGSGTLKYVSPGWSEAAASSVGAIECLCPAWSTGFFFPPDYPSKFPSENQNITTQLGNGYVQSAPRSLNNFDANPTFVYRNIDKRETKAIVNYVQDAANRPFEVLIPDQFISNQPNQKYRALAVSADPASFERYDVSVSLSRAFDI